MNQESNFDQTPLGQAAREARKISNLIKPFQDAEKVLNLAHQANEYIKSLDKSKLDKEREIAALREVISDLREAKAKASMEHQSALTANQEELDKAKLVAKNEVAQAKAGLLEKMDKAAEEKRAKLVREEETLFGHLEKIKTEISQAELLRDKARQEAVEQEGRLKAAQEGLDKLRARL